jgi:hypothetical protein
VELEIVIDLRSQGRLAGGLHRKVHEHNSRHRARTGAIHSGATAIEQATGE